MCLPPLELPTLFILHCPISSIGRRYLAVCVVCAAYAAPPLSHDFIFQLLGLVLLYMATPLHSLSLTSKTVDSAHAKVSFSFEHFVNSFAFTFSAHKLPFLQVFPH